MQVKCLERVRRGGDGVVTDFLQPAVVINPGCRGDRPGYGSAGRHGSGRGRRSSSCERRCAPAVPGRCGCRARPRAGGLRTSAVAYGRSPASGSSPAGRRRVRPLGSCSRECGGGSDGQPRGQSDPELPETPTAMPSRSPERDTFARVPSAPAHGRHPEPRLGHARLASFQATPLTQVTQFGAVFWFFGPSIARKS